MKRMIKHFKRLYGTTAPDTNKHTGKDNGRDKQGESFNQTNFAINIEEIETAIKKTKEDKSTGPGSDTD